MRSTTPIPLRGDGALARFVRRVAGAAVRRPKTTAALWLVLVLGCLAAGSLTGTRDLGRNAAGVGQSRQADELVTAAGLDPPAGESVLVHSPHGASTAATARDLEARLTRLAAVGTVHGPVDTPDLSTAGGRTVLVQATLRGDPDDAADHAAPVQRAVAAVAREHPGVRLQEAGDGTVEQASDHLVHRGLHRAELFSVPLTLIILVLAFGAVVAALVPLLLGLTSVAAALGLLGVVSQLAPIDPSASSLVVLIGLAVGVDYSLFYIRREREERRAGRPGGEALDAAAATVGRAVLVSGLTVMVALAGLLVTGLAVFVSMALATILVALIAVIGSLSVLPAVLSLLGDRVDRGRIPGLARLRARRPATAGPWSRLAGAVTRRPRAALVIALCLLGTLAVPALGMHTGEPGRSDLPRDIPAVAAQRAIEQAFPGSPDDAELVVTGRGLGASGARAGLAALGRRAARVTGGAGRVAVDVARGGGTAVASVPMPDRGSQAGWDTVQALRSRVAPTAARVAPGARALVTGDAAASGDFTHRLAGTTPIVIGAVLALAFALLLAAFRSPGLAATVMGLNLLSVGATYGLLVAVFQHSWAEGLLGFTSSQTIVNWIPLFAFVILFGLSMDYTVLVLERIREARRAGATARAAAAEGVGATAGTVTSAAIVMVAVFSVFATLPLLAFKQLGVGLAAAILIDATVVRGVALPAAVALLGERRWRVPRRRGAAAPELATAPGLGS